MLKLIITVTMFMTAVLCQAQISEIRKANHFSKIEIASGIELSYSETIGEASIKVECNEGNLTEIITEVDGATLKISAKGKMKNVKVFVSAKNIESFNVGSKSRIVFENTIHAENMSIILASRAYFQGYFKSNQSTIVTTDANATFNGRIETNSFEGNFENQSKVNISGTAKNASIKVASRAICNAKNFLTENAEIISNNSIVSITTNHAIHINATDNGSVAYFGSPKKAKVEEACLTSTRKYKRSMQIAMD